MKLNLCSPQVHRLSFMRQALHVSQALTDYAPIILCSPELQALHVNQAIRQELGGSGTCAAAPRRPA